jgi:predicted N-acetyltransferase YhbS
MARQKATVRVMKKEDIPSMVEIDGMASGSPRPEYLRNKMRVALDEERGMVISLVAEMDRKVVGFLMGEMYRGEFGIPENIATVDTVGVHPDFQNAGVGRQLIEEFVLHTKKAGAERVRTLVDWSQQWDLMGYFRASGFAPAGSSIVLERKI